MSDDSGRKPNRLAGQTSPYLLQHAFNPVDWYPWGPDALDRARSENRPILLSVGYAACHWCHVMEKESFEDPETARQMNERFVCIKVDREERPDIDSIYMDALVAMTGRGGWPMTMFLTPDAKPFYGGTYFPPDDRHGMPSFRRVLQGAYEAWLNRKDDVARQTEAVMDSIQTGALAFSDEPLEEALLAGAVRNLEASFDEEHGGFGPAPKFPQAPVLEFVLRAGAKGLGKAQQMLTTTLRAMALGGMYDQLGGGFARYSVDDRWLVPHFEKMLYDNAQLARVYTRAWQLQGSALYKRIAEETLEYMLRDLKQDAFLSSEDADSEGEEGKFYVWDYEEFMKVAPEAAGFYGVTPGGNFEGHNILTAGADEPPAESRQKLLEARSSRIRPGRDDKVLVSWNGLAISALAEASAAFIRPDLADEAAGAARFLLQKAKNPSGRLMHSYKDGRAEVPGMLEDYSYLAEGLLSLWEVSFEPAWLLECIDLCRQMLELFWDEKQGGFFSTGSDHEKLILRPKDLVDGATPSPNGVASLTLQKLAVVTGESEFSRRALGTLRTAYGYMSRAPQVAGTYLSALDFHLSTPQEVVIVGGGADAQALARQVWGRFLPNKVVAGAQDPAGSPLDSPMLEGKVAVDGKATAFVCENYSCRAPTSDPEQLGRQLAAEVP